MPIIRRLDDRAEEMVLDLWHASVASALILARLRELGIVPKVHDVQNVITRARKRGDPRAVRRRPYYPPKLSMCRACGMFIGNAKTGLCEICTEEAAKVRSL